jgi:membrane protein DedA with SNARE-associated domain
MPNSKHLWMRRKAPQIIVAILVIVAVAYVLSEVITDVVIEGAPITSGPLISAILSFKNTISSWGYSGVFFLMLLESSSLPIPSEAILPFAGYLVSKGTLNIWFTIAVATGAGLAGSLVDYFIGLKGVDALAKRSLLGRMILSPAQLETVARWFGKYGSIMVLLGRLLPGFRTLISFPAGATRMPLLKFCALTTAGCLAWNSILVYVGYYLGSNWAEVAGVSGYLIVAAAAVVIVIIGFYLVRILKNRSKRNLKPN